MKENKVPCENCEFCGMCNCDDMLPIKIVSGPVKRKIRIKNVILLAITGAMIALAMFSIASIASCHWIPFVGLFISGTWLVLFAKANGWLDVDVEGEADDE